MVLYFFSQIPCNVFKFLIKKLKIIYLCLVCSTTVADEIYISPLIYDVQNNIETAIRIKGLASTIDMIKQTTCNVMDLDSQIVMVINNPN